MKHLLLILAVLIIGCSSDDGVPVEAGSVEIENYHYTDDYPVDNLNRYTFYANVINNTDKNITGKVQFKTKSGNGFVYSYIDGYSIPSGLNQTRSQLSNIYFEGDLEIVEVTFIE